MTISNKELVKQRFNKNLKTYKCEAIVQKEISKALGLKLSEITNTKFNKVLEIGCGTGFLTKEITNKLNPESLYLNDLVADAYDETLDYAKRNNLNVNGFIEGDAESIDFPANLDGIFSSSCFQWFNDFEFFLKKANKLLKKDGILAFSTFGEYHFNEIRQLTGQGLEYRSLPELLDLLEEGFEILYADEWQHEEEFRNPQDVLRHMKNTGVNGLTQGYFGREKMKQFIQEYWQNFSKDFKTVRLTYHPILIIAKNISPLHFEKTNDLKPLFSNSIY